MISLSWRSVDESMVYFNATDGYLAGGFNTTSNDKSKAKFDAQKSRNYQLGTKLPLLNNTMIVDAAVYYIDITDIHVWEVLGPSTWAASNAGKAHSQGYEVEVALKPVESIELQLGWSAIEAKYDDYEMNGIDYAGNRIPRTPSYTASLRIKYRNELGIFAQLETQVRGKTYYDDENALSQDPYELFNAKIGYEMQNWDIYLVVRNLTDTQYGRF